MTDSTRLDVVRQRLKDAMREEHETCERLAAENRVADEHIASCTAMLDEWLAPTHARLRDLQAERKALYAEYIALGGDPAEPFSYPPPQPPLVTASDPHKEAHDDRRIHH